MITRTFRYDPSKGVISAPDACLTRRLRAGHGFTLVEVLVVLAIISLLVAAVTPGFVDVMRSTRLTSSGDAILNRISLAQQAALSGNVPVEFRFYKYKDAEDPLSGEQFRAYQVVQLGEASINSSSSGATYGSPVAITPPIYLDSGIVIADSGLLSPLLQSTFDEGKNLFEIADAQYAALRFYPDGSFKQPMTTAGGTGAASETGVVTPALANSFFTLAEQIELEGSSANVPKNYYCIQLDPYTGRARLYRP